MENKECLECGVLVKGRIDKKFCSDYCRNSFNNKVNKIELVAKYNIIAIGDQKCVITLNPIKFNIKEFFNMKFKNIKNIDLSSLEDEFIEPIYNNNINFSEIGVQMFASFLSPYPKINNGKIDLKSISKDDVNNEENNNNPFEVLNNINK